MKEENLRSGPLFCPLGRCGRGGDVGPAEQQNCCDPGESAHILTTK